MHSFGGRPRQTGRRRRASRFGGDPRPRCRVDRRNLRPGHGRAGSHGSSVLGLPQAVRTTPTRCGSRESCCFAGADRRVRGWRSSPFCDGPCAAPAAPHTTSAVRCCEDSPAVSATDVVVFSQQNAALASDSWGGRTVHPIAAGVPEAMCSRDPLEIRRELGVPDGATVVGLVGRLTGQKRQQVWLRALAQSAQARRGSPWLAGG